MTLFKDVPAGAVFVLPEEPFVPLQSLGNGAAVEIEGMGRYVQISTCRRVLTASDEDFSTQENRNANG